MGCIFSASGADLDADACLRECHFSPFQVFRKGETCFYLNTTRKHSGFKVRVSEADFSDFAKQIEDAMWFLESNRTELQKLQDFPNVQRCLLDFPVEEHSVDAKGVLLSSRLPELAGDLGIDIEITYYPIPKEDNATQKC